MLVAALCIVHPLRELCSILHGNAGRQAVHPGAAAYRVSDEISITGTARVLDDPDVLRSQLTLQLTRTAGNADYSVGLTSLLGPEPRRDILTATLTYSF